MWWPFYALVTTLWLAWCTMRWRAYRPALHGVPSAMGVIAFSWIVTRISHVYLYPDHMQYYPITDAVCVLMLIAMMRSIRQTWLLTLMLLFVADTFIHAAWFNQTRSDLAARYIYGLALNLVYLAQLSCVAVHCLLAPRKST